MTVTLYASVGVTDVSSRVTKIDVWRKATEGIGQATLLLHNQDKGLNGLFAYKDVVVITVNNAALHNGYAEKSVPTSRQQVSAAYEKFLILSSLDYGKDLLNRVCDAIYPKQRADAIFNAMLSGSEITFPDYPLAVEPPSIQYEEGIDRYLVESFRSMLEFINYDGFVNASKQWKMFPIGTVDSGVTLKCVAGATDNTIIGPIKNIEFDGFELYTYIIVRGAKIDDGWTEGNHDGWAGEANNVLSGEFTLVKVGAASVKIAIGAGASVSAYLTFPRYNFDYLDFSTMGSSEMSMWMYQSMEAPYTTIENPIITLIDNAAKTISYTFSGVRLHLLWHQLTVPMGTECTIHASGDDCWVGDTDFNWKIVSIKIYGGAHVEYMLIDGLALPFKMLAVAQDTVHYGTRMLPLTDESIKSQVELDQLVASTLEKRQETMSMLELTAVGSAGIVGGVYKFLPGYKVTVNSPDDGLSNAEYRIFTSHDIVAENVQAGHNFVCELKLVPVSLKMDTQRLSYDQKPEVALLRGLHDRLRFLELKDVRERDWWPPLPKDLPADRVWENKGTAFPASPLDMQRFYRTDLDQWFRYSETTSSWIPVDFKWILSTDDPTYIDGKKVWVTRGTSFPPDPVDYQPFYRTDLDVRFLYIDGYGWCPHGGPNLGTRTTTQTPDLNPTEYNVVCSALKGLYHDCGWQDVGATFTYPNKENAKHELTKVTVEAKRVETGDVVAQTTDLRCMVSINGADWTQFGAATGGLSTSYTLKTFTGDYKTALNLTLYVKLQAHITVQAGVSGAGNVYVYVRNFKTDERASLGADMAIA